VKRDESNKRASVSTANPLEAAAAEGLATVVLVGRANAGKSTLFNRIVRRGRAIVSPIAGTTRDLNLGRATHEDHEFIIADSGGLELYANEAATERAVEEALRAVAAADVVVFLVDGHAGISNADEEALTLIRATGKPLIAAVNKVDNRGRETAAAEAYQLGLSDVVFISAAHGLGVGELLDAIVAKLRPGESTPERAADLRVALIGRPNAGKSSILNRLAGFNRSIVDDHPGTTRDPVDVRLRAGDREVMLIDTAGMRRPTKVQGILEHHSVGRAIETIKRAEVLIVVIDATEGITDQDVRLARLVESNDRAMVIVCNKWDAASAAGKRVPAFVSNAYRRHPFLEFAPMIFTSALTGDGIEDIIPAAARAGEGWHSTFQTAQLNRILADVTEATDPPLIGQRRLKLMYVTQTGSAPPRLTFFANVQYDIPAHYMRFLENQFRTALRLNGVGTPLRFQFRRTGRSWMDSKPKRAEPATGKPRPKAETTGKQAAPRKRRAAD
jgi:GTPase